MTPKTQVLTGSDPEEDGEPARRRPAAAVTEIRLLEAQGVLEAYRAIRAAARQSSSPGEEPRANTRSPRPGSQPTRRAKKEGAP